MASLPAVQVPEPGSPELLLLPRGEVGCVKLLILLRLRLALAPFFAIAVFCTPPPNFAAGSAGPETFLFPFPAS